MFKLSRHAGEAGGSDEGVASAQHQTDVQALHKRWHEFICSEMVRGLSFSGPVPDAGRINRGKLDKDEGRTVNKVLAISVLSGVV